MTIDDRTTRATLTVDLDAIVANYRLLAARAAPSVCAPAVKADAYGLGLARVAPVLHAAGARLFFVAHLDEGLALRRLLPDAEVAVLNGLFAPEVAAYHDAALTPVLNDLNAIDLWRAHGRGRPAFVHVDTGMNRLGLGPDELDRLTDQPSRLDGVAVRGWISHMACADTPDHPLNAAQHGAFGGALGRLPPAPASLANSAAIFLGRPYHFDLVRPGCALYGINPTPATENPMRPVVTLTAPILQLRTVSHPATIGYGATADVRPGMKIATIAIGYADGFMRHLSNRGILGMQGRPVAVIGRVSMDLVAVDVTGVPDHLIIPGQGEIEILGPGFPADRLAAAGGTIGYEVLTSLGRRFRRAYHSNEFPEWSSSRRSAVPS